MKLHRLPFAAGMLVLALPQQTTRTTVEPPRQEKEPAVQQLAPPVKLVYRGVPLTLASVDAPEGENIALVATARSRDTGANATGLKVEATTTGEDLLLPPVLPATGLDVSVLAQDSRGRQADATGMTMDVRALGYLYTTARGLKINAVAGADDAGAAGIVVSAVANGGQSASTVGGSFSAVSNNGYPLSDALGVDASATGNPSAIGDHIGVRGTCTIDGGYGVFSRGNFGATGSKAFVQPHPVDPGRVVQFISLEGNESGTYFRGSGRLVNGVAEIAVPEEWALVSEDHGITVQLTRIGSAGSLWVAERGRHRIVVRGEPDGDFDYFVNGVRRGFADYEPYRENRAYRPEVRGVPFGAQYPPDLRAILVENGILNPDYTPNEQTAARMGWDLEDAADRAK